MHTGVVVALVIASHHCFVKETVLSIPDSFIVNASETRQYVSLNE